MFLQLIDSRHPELEIDAATRDFLKSFKRKDFAVIEVFTKVDKLNVKELNALKAKYPDGIFVSASSKKGIDGLRDTVYGHIFGGLE